MAIELSKRQVVGLSFSYVLLFFLSAFMTSLVAAVDVLVLAVFTGTVIIYWLLAAVITRINKIVGSFREIFLKVFISLLVIMAVITVQQLMFLNISFLASFLFFAISFILLILLHLLFFKWIGR